MKQLKTWMIASVGTAALACAGSTFATTWSLKFQGLGPSRVTGINFNQARAWNAGTVGSFSYFGCGEMKWKNMQNGQQLTTFCTQINEHISNNQTVSFQEVPVTMVPDSPPAPGPMGAIKATVLKDLYARYYHSVHASGNADQNSGFQMLVWEITHENVTALTASAALGQLNLFKGALQVDNNYAVASGAVAFANFLLGELGGANDNDFRAFGNNDDSLRGLRNDTYQDQLLVVPVPMTLGLAAVGLVGAWRLRRRMKA